ncbi:MAG: hypothetical protein ABSE82_04900 [Nitrososphaerales archaeon]|jgi:hypothetical protein
MQNIDLLYFISPIVIIAFSFGLVIYWHYKKSFSKWALAYSLAAYAGAIALKYIVQIPTYTAVESASGNNPLVLGLYFGIQTGVFEVGGAFLVASYAVSRGHFKANDAEGFGLGLAMWENGVLIAIPLLLNYIIYYAVLSTPNSTYAQTLYSDLTKDAPSLFYGTSGASPVIGYAILERITSLLGHFSWGYLAVLSAVYRKKIYLAIAMPIGFSIDFLVPFAQRLGTGPFELVVFLIAAGGLIAALAITRGVREKMKTTGQQNSQTAPQGDLISLGVLSVVNLKRSINYGKIYLILGIIISLGVVLATAFLPTTPETTQYVATQGKALGITNAGTLVIVSIYPIFSPLFAVIGSLGALMIFASDKAKGVYEYLISYGVNTSTIFWSTILSAVGLVTIVLGISLTVVTSILAILNGSIPFQYVELVLIYTIPLSYSVTMFTTIIGMIWSSLTTRRAGVNSPVGLAPIFGMVPMIFVIIVSESVPSSYLVPLVSGVSLALVLMVIVMIAISNKKIVRERFISSG